jgi:hypothetical protein
LRTSRQPIIAEAAGQRETRFTERIPEDEEPLPVPPEALHALQDVPETQLICRHECAGEGVQELAAGPLARMEEAGRVQDAAIARLGQCQDQRKRKFRETSSV